MIEIISGPTNSSRKEFTCPNCGTVFQADKWDYEYSNCNNDNEYGYRITCPTCNQPHWYMKERKRLDYYSDSLYVGMRDVK